MPLIYVTRYTVRLSATVGRTIVLSCLLLTSFAAFRPPVGNAQDSDSAQQFRQGNEEMRSGHPERAEQHFRAVIKRNPKLAEAYLNLGLAYEQMGKQVEAAEALTHAVSLKGTLPGANLFLGIADYRLNRLDAATKALQTEIANNPNSAKALMWLGVTALAENRPEEAATALDKANALNPRDLDIMYHRGRAHLLVSKNAYEAMFTASPDFWRVHQVLGEAYQEADRHADAITEYRLAVKQAPTEPGLHDRLGDELWKNGALDEADQAFSEELKLDPDSITGLYHLGRLRVTRSDRGQVENGVALLQKALAQDPTMSQVEYYLGRGTAQLGNNAVAIQHYENSVKGDPNGDVAQQAYYQLAHLYRQMKQPEAASAALANFSRLKKQADADQKHKFENRFDPDSEVADKQIAKP